MPLTYQPFAETEAVDELRRDLDMNVSDQERISSGVVGAGFVAFGLSRNGWAKWLYLALGGALLYRGWTGQCSMYRALEIDKRHPARGVPGNRGIKIQRAIEVGCAPGVLYRFWRDLKQLPRIMRHVQSVEETGRNQSHWRVNGPAGQSIEWDAEIINDIEGKLIAWQSLPGSSVQHAGSVWFELVRPGATRVKVAFEFDPPGGVLGAGIADMLGSSPDAQLAADLTLFKEFAERELCRR